MRAWDIEITELIVDEPKRSVMARADFSMTVFPGKVVMNDLIVTMKMDHSGEKLIECTEFPDPTATAEIQRLLTEGQ